MTAIGACVLNGDYRLAAKTHGLIAKKKVTRPGLEPELTVSKTVVLAITLSGHFIFTKMSFAY
jgi:hypothetical protein